MTYYLEIKQINDILENQGLKSIFSFIRKLKLFKSYEFL